MIAALLGGLALTGLVTAILVAAWGRATLTAGIAFGLLATAIQIVSAGLVARAAQGEFKTLIRRWATGMGLRVAGVAVFGLAVWLDRERFPPVPSATAYLGVLIPLLFWETRFLR